jgi:hypothetical protein
MVVFAWPVALATFVLAGLVPAWKKSYLVKWCCHCAVLHWIVVCAVDLVAWIVSDLD